MEDEEEINLEDTFDITHELENPNSPFANVQDREDGNDVAPDLLGDGFKSETEDDSLGMDSSDMSDQTRNGHGRTFMQSVGVGVVFIQCCKSFANIHIIITLLHSGR